MTSDTLIEAVKYQMNEQLSARITLHNTLAKRLSMLSDQELFSLLQSTENTYSGFGGKAAILELDGVKIFTKKLPLTALELQTENLHSTANLFHLPMSCHIGVGSPGFGAWRELLVHETTTNWVISGQCENFPIMYHWRALPAMHQLQPITDEEMKKLDEQVEYWDNSSEVRNRLESIRNSSTDLLVFLEYIPERLFDWLKRKLLAGGQAAIDVVAFIDVQLKQTNAFMNANGLIHFDAHFANILADDNAIYYGDFGLSLYDKFDLLKNEKDLFAEFKSYDNASSFTNLLHCIIAGVYNRDLWEVSLNDYLGGKLEQLESPVTRIIDRYSKIALTMHRYYKNMQKVSKSTVYPAKEIEKLLNNVDLVIETERLHLRQWRISDISALATINQDPKVMEYFPAPKTYAETEAFVLANMQLFNKDQYSIFAVELTEAQSLIGFVGIQKVGLEMPFAPAVEILWRFDSRYWGQGYAYEAAKAVVDYAFKEFGITELVSFTVPDNMRSRKLMQRLDFVHEPEYDFAHPKIALDHKLNKHVFYRLRSKHIKIDLLKNHPLAIPALANIWHEVLGKIWMPEIGVEEIESGYYEELNEDLPLAYVALYDEIPVGTCSLQLDGGIRPDLKPWLGDLVVDPKYQKQGIGKMLVDVAVKKAKALGFEKLYLFAFDPTILEYYQRLGWRKIGMDEFNSHPVTVMEINIL